MSRVIVTLLCALSLWSLHAPRTAHAQVTRAPKSVTTLADALNRGPTDADAVQLVLALGKTGSIHALQTLREAMLHRVVAVRIAAVQSLSLFVGNVEVAAHVALALRDHNSQVRGAAARALSAMKARAQVDVLLLAFERGVPEAAVAIGDLGDDSQLPAFTAFLGRKPLTQMLAGYQAWLVRTDLGEETKLKIVSTLEEMSGVSVKRFLQGLIDADVLAGQPNVQRAITTTITRIVEPKP